MSIQHCFDTGAIVTDLECTDKFDALRELIRRAPVFREIPRLDDFEKSVLERERLHTTGLGHGVAVAHGRTPGVERVLIAMGVSHKGIPYESPDGEPVRLLFVIASPQPVTLDYLQALSTLVRCLRSSSLRDSLLAAPDADALEGLIRDAFADGLGRLVDPLDDRQASSSRRSCGAAG